jgi:hypothetical protein
VTIVTVAGIHTVEAMSTWCHRVATVRLVAAILLVADAHWKPGPCAQLASRSILAQNYGRVSGVSAVWQPSSVVPHQRKFDAAQALFDPRVAAAGALRRIECGARTQLEDQGTASGTCMSSPPSLGLRCTKSREPAGRARALLALIRRSRFVAWLMGNPSQSDAERPMSDARCAPTVFQALAGLVWRG